MEVVVLVEGEVEFMGLLEVCIMGLGDLVMVGAWVATVEVMVGALEDLWEEVTEMVGVVMEFMEDASHIKEDFTEALLEALLEVVMAWVAMDMDNGLEEAGYRIYDSQTTKALQILKLYPK